jgi:hypothetical protein
MWSPVVIYFAAAVLIDIGSRRLSHFDAALIGYTFATLFAVFGTTDRSVIWLQRPQSFVPVFCRRLCFPAAA